MSDERLERIEKRQDDMANDIKGLKTKVTSLDSKVTSLDSKVTSLDSKVTSLDNKVTSLRISVCGLEGDVKSLKEGQAEHSEMLAFVVQKMNEMSEDNRRWFEVSLENHRDDMRAIRDLFQINRDRLDSHEDRLNRLEAC